MRQVFTSLRLENVEAVAELLRAEGIEVKITDGRSYRGNRRSNFSYRDTGNAGAQPAVWIVRAEDQPRGRQLLREAGLLESSRAGESSYLSLAALNDGKADAAAAKSARASRIKLGLLALIAVVIVLMVFTTRTPTTTDAPMTPSAAPVATPAPVIVPQQIDDPQVFRVDVPTALAKLLIETETAKRAPAQACIAIDGKDPSPQFMQSLRRDAKTQLYPASACPDGNAYDIDVHDYMTDGSGSGEVHLMLDVEDARIVEVEREGERWRVLGVR